MDELRVHVGTVKASSSNGSDKSTRVAQHPRWVRINSLRTTLERQMSSTFADFVRTDEVINVTGAESSESSQYIYIDDNIPNLVAIPPTVDIASTKAYKEGKLILQDKASCFPAYLLNPTAQDGSVIDACAAPGNKTTHLAALVAQDRSELDSDAASIVACERDAARSQTLEKMVKLAGADSIVRIRSKQDFLKLKPQSAEFANVTALLLDPSCSGSGIVGRDEASVTVHLPRASAGDVAVSKGKKRKRAVEKPAAPAASAPATTDDEELPIEEDNEAKLQARLNSLSAFQLRIVQHAMSFPSAQRIAYSTCSVHAIENEHVVIKALQSPVAREQGWRIMRRDDQIDGMRRWHRRGWLEPCQDIVRQDHDVDIDVAEVTEACIRCEKGSDDGTMGFFLAGFVRDGPLAESCPSEAGPSTSQQAEAFVGESVADDAVVEEEWNGFDED